MALHCDWNLGSQLNGKSALQIGRTTPHSQGPPQRRPGAGQCLPTEKHQINRSHQPSLANGPQLLPSATPTPAPPASLHSDGFLYPKCLPCPPPHTQMFPSLQDPALISSCLHLAEVWQRQAFEREVLSPSQNSDSLNILSPPPFGLRTLPILD